MGQWIYKVIPVNRYDVARMESWLEDLSEQGLELAGIVSFVGLFRQVEPRRRKCRLEPADLFPEGRLEERLESYIRCGWEAVADIEGVFYVFMSTIPEPAELHTDPVAQSYEYKNLRQKRSFYCYESILTLLLNGAVITNFFVQRWGLFGGLVKGPVFVWAVLEIAVLLLMVRNICNVAHIWRLYSRLKKGQPIERGVDWRKHRLLQLLGHEGVLSILIMVFGIAALAGVGESPQETRNYPELAAALPVLELAEMEGEAFSYESLVTPSGVDVDNTVSFQKGLLAPEQYEVAQQGRMRDTGRSVELQAEYCRTTFAWLAKGYYREVLAAYQEEYGAEPRVLAPDGFDEGVIWETKDETRMLLRKGSIVLDYEYEGGRDLAAFARAAAERCGR